MFTTHPAVLGTLSLSAPNFRLHLSSALFFFFFLTNYHIPVSKVERLNVNPCPAE